MVLVFLAIVGGVIFAEVFHITSVPLWSLIGIVGSILTLTSLEFLNFRGKTLLVIAALFFLGITLYGIRYFDPGSLYSRINSSKNVEGKVISYPKNSNSGTEFTLKPDDSTGKLKIFLTSKEVSKVNYGDKLIIDGNLQIPPRFQDFDYREYLRKKEIWGVVYQGEVISSSSEMGNLILELGWRLRKIITTRIESLFPEQGSFLIALLFGDRDVLNENVTNSFTKTGLAHLLAASGLHLGIILGVSWWLLLRLGLPKSKIYLLSLPVLFLYLMIVGFKLPLLRASLIYFFGGAHFYLRKRGQILDDWYDPYQGLASAALLLVIINPNAISTAGFQLSFGATFAIAQFLQPIKKNLPLKPDYLSGILAASLAAQLGVIPVLVVHFHQIHPWAPIANLAAIPGVSAILYLGILSLALGKIVIISPVLIWLETRLISTFQWAIGKLSTIPLTQIQLPSVTPLVLLSYFILVYWIKRRLVSLPEIKNISV